MRKSTIFTVLLSAFLIALTSQGYSENFVYKGKEANKIVPGSVIVRDADNSSIPSYVKFAEGKEINVQVFTQWLKTTFEMGNDYGFTLLRTEKDQLGMVHYRYGQTYKGVLVKTGVYIAHSKENKVVSMNGAIYNDFNLPQNPALTEAQALGYALNHVNAETYRWENPEEEKYLKTEQKDPSATYYPKGELFYAAKDGKFTDPRKYKLTWKFNIYASTPLYRADVFVDAITGEIIYEDNLIKHADVVGVAETQYSGLKNIIADDTGPFRLREAARGNGIRTYDLNQGTNYGSAVDFTDNDNYWANYNPQLDEYATDAHFGTEMTYDYYFLEHSRNSIDDNGFALLSYVHYSTNYVNAFWDGQRMTYGDGNNSYTPLTTLDICGHEVTHGLTSNTSNLVYSYESGALNESFSDIFGTCIEFYGDSVNPDWLIGEDIGSAFRSMSNPGTYNDPDCYLGNNWATGPGDNGGVHTNSGVQNFWFYLLSIGGSGTNDNNDFYTVNGLGITDAARIAWRNNTVYLISSSQYADSRFFAIQSANDLFGACSPEVIETTNAWYAVCVGAEWDPQVSADFTAGPTTSCTVPTTVNFTNISTNATVFYWDFGDGGNSTLTNPSYSYTQAGTYTVTLIASGACGADTIVYTNLITISLPASPTTTDGYNCGPGTVNLSATGAGTLDWYDQQIGGTWVNTGPTYTTPFLPVTTSYWVEDVIGNPPQNVGPPDNNIGAGANYNGDRHLIFDVIAPCTLVSVVVYASGSGNRTIEMRDDQQTVIQSLTVNMVNGQQTITLNWPLTPGIDFELGVPGNNNDLYRNSTGANYPYTLPGLVSITGCNAPVTYYYFYYDWVIQEPSCSSAREEVIAEIVDAPTVSISGSDTICSGDPVTLTANGTNIDSYSWSTGGTNSSITENPLVQTTYTVTVSNLYNCATAQASFTVNIEPAPTVSINGNNSICQGDTTTLTTTGTNINSYLWSTGGTNSSVDVSPGAPTTYFVTVTGDCGTAVGSFTVDVTNQPSVTMSNDTTICEGNSVIVSANGTGTYLWSTGGTTASFSVNPTVTTTYVVTVTGNCGTVTDSVTVNVDPVPVAAFSNSINNLIVTFSDLSANASTWAWDFGDGSPIDNSQNPVHTYVLAGTYNVCLTVTNNCGSNMTCDSVTVSGSGLPGMLEIANLGGLLIYPNPTRDLLHLQFLSFDVQDIEVRMMSVMGQLLFSENLEQFSGNYSKAYLLNELARGVYILQIKTEAGVLNERIIVE